MGLLALAANTACLLLLLRHRSDDINMKSTWVCSRNDIIGNLGVLAASVAVAVTGSKWPDIAVGLVIASVFLLSAFSTLRDSVAQLRSASD